MGQFKPMPKMETTEPSVILKLKKGGVAKKAMGGALPVGQPQTARLPAIVPPTAPAMAAARPRGATLMASRAPMRPSPGMPAQAMGRKKGGEIEGKAEHAKEEREIKGIKKELMSHEGKPASKAHKGLKMGGLAGGISPTRSDDKGTTGKIEGKGYKRGGKTSRTYVANDNLAMVKKARRGYADGGHVAMGCKSTDGFKANKKGGSF